MHNPTTRSREYIQGFMDRRRAVRRTGTFGEGYAICADEIFRTLLSR